MTVHTYKVSWSKDYEARSPQEAAQNLIVDMVEVVHDTVSNSKRPILRVEQFVDTDKAPRIFEVDSLYWDVKEIDRPGTMVFLVTETGAAGDIDFHQSYMYANEAHEKHRALLLDYLENHVPDIRSFNLTYQQLCDEYDAWHEHEPTAKSVRLIVEHVR